MKTDLLRILQHSLGLDQYGQGSQYRNHYVAGGDDVALCRELVSLGHMLEQSASTMTGGSPLFNVTRAGINAVRFESPTPPKLTRSQRRYLEYLNADCFDSFHHFLKYTELQRKGLRHE